MPVPVYGNRPRAACDASTARRNTVRRLIQWTLVPVALVAVACRGDKPTQARMTDELKRDLQLASATQDIKLSPDEVAPKATQELALRPKRAPNGPKVVRTEKPTVKASSTPVEAAEVQTELPQIQVMASAPSPSETPNTTDAPPLARPAALPAPTYPTAEAINVGNGGSGTGAGGVMGGIFGAVIRGGRVGGGDDHCDPRTDGRRRPPGQVIGSGGIYTMPGTMVAGGMGAGRSMPATIARPRGGR
jgi:hypothetical protein